MDHRNASAKPSILRRTARKTKSSTIKTEPMATRRRSREPEESAPVATPTMTTRRRSREPEEVAPVKLEPVKHELDQEMDEEPEIKLESLMDIKEEKFDPEFVTEEVVNGDEEMVEARPLELLDVKEEPEDHEEIQNQEEPQEMESDEEEEEEEQEGEEEEEEEVEEEEEQGEEDEEEEVEEEEEEKQEEEVEEEAAGTSSHGEAFYQAMVCILCKAQTSTLNTLKKHVELKHENYCRCCNVLFNSKTDFLAHVQNHTDGKISAYLCKTCGFETVSSTAMKNHLSSEHNVKKDYEEKIEREMKRDHANSEKYMKKFKCPFCMRHIDSLEQLREHLRSGWRMTCQKCSNEFTNPHFGPMCPLCTPSLWKKKVNDPNILASSVQVLPDGRRQVKYLEYVAGHDVGRFGMFVCKVRDATSDDE